MNVLLAVCQKSCTLGLLQFWVKFKKQNKKIDRLMNVAENELDCNKMCHGNLELLQTIEIKLFGDDLIKICESKKNSQTGLYQGLQKD